jgi:hypothetical protein
MSDDRSERLRETRNRAKERVQESGEAPDSDESAVSSKLSESSEVSEPSEPSDTSEPNGRTEMDTSSAGSVKDERVGTYMYLPESQQKELSRLYNILKAEYEYEFDAEFEKNRHFYPLVIEYGIDSLDSLEASDIQERLQTLDI